MLIFSIFLLMNTIASADSAQQEKCEDKIHAIVAQKVGSTVLPRPPMTSPDLLEMLSGLGASSKELKNRANYLLRSLKSSRSPETLIENLEVNNARRKFGEENRLPSRYSGVKSVHIHNQTQAETPPAPSISERDPTLYSELQKTLDITLKQLNLTQQKIVDLHYFRGLTVEKISEHLKMPIGTVKSNLFRAQKKMREDQALKQYFEGRFENND